MRRWWGVVWVALALVASACGGGDGSTGEASPSPPAPAHQALAVDVRTEQFADTSRGIAAYRDHPASPSRPLPTRIVAPVGGQPGRPYPLIVFSHGSGGLGDGYDALFRTWAGAGYVVAAPAFPVASEESEQGDWTTDLPNLPADVRFVIDEILRGNAGLVDPAHIGVAGHSMGGMVTLAVAGNTCCHDPRVKAAVVLAGRETPLNGQFWARISTPILLVHGDDDRNVTYADGRRAYADAPPPRFLLTILGGDHGTPYTGDPANPQAKLVADATLDFFDQYLRGAADGVAHLKARTSAPAGVARLEQER